MSPTSVTERFENLWGKHSGAIDGGASEGVRKEEDSPSAWMWKHDNEVQSRKPLKRKELVSSGTGQKTRAPYVSFANYFALTFFPLLAETSSSENFSLMPRFWISSTNFFPGTQFSYRIAPGAQ